MNEQKENRGGDKPIKRTDPSIQGIVETQMEIVEAENYSLFNHRCSLHCALTMECPSMK